MNTRATARWRSDAEDRDAAAARHGSSPAVARWRVLLGAGLIVVLALVAYGPLVSAGFIWDDDSYVTGNATLRDVDGLRRIWFDIGAVPQYYPLVHSTFWVEYHLWGLHPLGYHLVNVLLHITSSLLVWRLLARWQVPGAWLAAAIFAVHPVAVESVAWITERKNVLSLTLALAALLCYFRGSPAAVAESRMSRRATGWGWYALGLVLFTGALLSKTVVASLPAVILVLCWWQRGRVDARQVAQLAPFFALGIGLGLVTVWMERHHVGAEGADWSFTIAQRFLIAGRALWFYAAKLIWPHPLVFFYPRWQIDDPAPWQFAFPLAVLTVVAALWFACRRLGRGPLAGVLVFAGVLTPALGFVNVYPMRFSFVADHFQYHASLALIATLVGGATLLARRSQIVGSKASCTLAAVILIALTALTFSQARVYENLETLYRATIAGNPTGPTAYANLGVYLSSLGQYEEATRLARTAVALGPREAAAHNTLGVCLLQTGSQPGADPGQIGEAIAEFRLAVEILPSFGDARLNLGTALSAAGRADEAFDELQQVLSQNPNYAEAHYALAGLLAARGDLPGAEQHFRAAVTLRPEYYRAINNLGVVLMNLGETDEAIHYFAAAVRLAPDYAEARRNLENARQVKNQPSATP